MVWAAAVEAAGFLLLYYYVLIRLFISIVFSSNVIYVSPKSQESAMTFGERY